MTPARGYVFGSKLNHEKCQLTNTHTIEADTILVNKMCSMGRQKTRGITPILFVLNYALKRKSPPGFPGRLSLILVGMRGFEPPAP